MTDARDDMKVVELFPKGNASNVPAMLRQAAEVIEAETDDDNRTEAVIAVQLHENGEIQLYGWGNTDSMRAIATLSLGLHLMQRQHLEEL